MKQRDIRCFKQKRKRRQQRKRFIVEKMEITSSGRRIRIRVTNPLSVTRMELDKMRKRKNNILK